LQKKLSEKTVKVIGRFKDTLKETLLLEDYEEEGVIAVEQLRECLKSIQVDGCDEEMIQFVEYIVYTRGGGEGTHRMKYGVLLDLLDNRFQSIQRGSTSNGPASLGTSTESRKQQNRPESSSPEKLKARNREKFQGGPATSGGGIAKAKPAANDEEDEYE
jgi:hypothetical protein